MTKQKKFKIAAVTGATASGKTRLALKLAEEFNGEIISVDSRQIYKELNIGAAKPSVEERRGIEHHLIDAVSITQEYTAANFADDAKAAIEDIVSRGKLPVLAGGTGLYFRVLLQDFDLPRTAPDKALREELEQFSSKGLHDKLFKLDPETAVKIHPNNKVKIIRALEVCLASGIPMSQAQKKKEAEYDTLWLGLESSSREFIYNRINNRTDEMLKKGLLNEAEHLFKHYGENKILTGTIGYKEFLPYIKGETDYESTVNLIKQNTRRYAKRQISWFKQNSEIHRFYINKQSFEEIEEKACSLLLESVHTNSLSQELSSPLK